ncbi:MAG: aminotransferase class I/II-fold pyridoxal phosphate-dependent enzyme [Comamonadaceae bacterium]|nr:aminotransferase class I/II-fold pyridoxal phosphate-dependent enzyme [Comamonadaceae bacterium]
MEQHAAIEAHRLGKDYFQKIRDEYMKRRDVVYNRLIGMEGVFCKKPNGAFYIIAKLPLKNALEFAEWLLTKYTLNQETVLVAPANGFYGTEGLGTDEIRLAYIIRSEELEKAMTILAAGLVEYRRQYPDRCI